MVSPRMVPFSRVSLVPPSVVYLKTVVLKTSNKKVYPPQTNLDIAFFHYLFKFWVFRGILVHYK